MVSFKKLFILILNKKNSLTRVLAAVARDVEELPAVDALAAVGGVAVAGLERVLPLRLALRVERLSPLLAQLRELADHLQLPPLQALDLAVPKKMRQASPATTCGIHDLHMVFQ